MIEKTLDDILSLGFRLLIKKDGYNQARITVVDKTNISHSQLIPFSHLTEGGLSECIDFCKHKLIEKLK